MKIRNKIGQFIYGLGSGVVYVLAALIALYLFFASTLVTGFMAYEDEHVFFVKDIGPGMVVGLLILLFLLRLITKARKEESEKPRLLKGCCVIVTALVVLFLIKMIETIHLAPIYDQLMIFRISEMLLQGNVTEWAPGAYMDMFPFQNGMVLMMLPFAKLGDHGMFVFQYVNILFLIAACIGLSMITAEYFGKRTAYRTYLAAILLMPVWGLVTIVYCFMAQIAFGIWGCYFLIRFMRSEKYRYLIFGILCLEIGYLCKTNGILFVITCAIALFMQFCKTGKRRIFLGVTFVIAFTWLTSTGLHLLMVRLTGYEGMGGISLWGYFATGFSESSTAPGWFSDIHTALYKAHYDDPAWMKAEYMRILSERVSIFAENPDYGMRFFARKVGSMWADPAFQLFTNISIRNLGGTLSYGLKDALYNGGVINTVLYLFLDVVQSVVYFGCVLYFGSILRKRGISSLLDQGMLWILFLGGFLYHFLGEAKSYYVLPYYLVMIPYCVRGFEAAASEMMDKKAHKSTTIRATVVILVVTAGLMFIPSKTVDATLRFGTDTGEYIWYLQSDLPWKYPDYKKD